MLEENFSEWGTLKNPVDYNQMQEFFPTFGEPKYSLNLFAIENEFEIPNPLQVKLFGMVEILVRPIS